MEVERPPSIVPSLIMAVIGVVVALMVLSWIVGAIFSLLRFVVLVGGAIAIIWAVMSSRSRR